MNTLRYLTLDLFLYDLYSEVQETNLFKLIKPPGTGQQERFPERENGYYYAFKLAGDSGALQIDYSGSKDEWGSPVNLTQIQQFKEFILKKADQFPRRLGRNWFISAQLIDPQTPDTIAQRCYEALNLSQNLDWNRDLKGTGKFKNISFFELEQFNPTADGINQALHVIICLFPPNASEDDIRTMIGQLYRDFLHLFLYRNKVLWMYEQASQRKRVFSAAQDAVQRIYRKITKKPCSLNTLQEILSEDVLPILYQYEFHLGRLQAQTATIETNLRNYKSQLQRLKKRDPINSLEFLDRFSTSATEEWLTQIQADNLAFTAGMKPIEAFIKTVQGITEIEKAKNDRRFSRIVASATVGVSTASLATATLNRQSETAIKALLPPPPSWCPLFLIGWWPVVLPFMLSLIIGVMGAVLAWTITGWSARRR